jgi:23S rRNA (cytosine1962-C5)-methyltransferase
MARIILKPGRDKNLRARHPWVFSGAIGSVKGKLASGETVEVAADNGDLIGMGAWSPQSQIQLRMWSFGPAEIGRDFFAARIAEALEHRRQLGVVAASSDYRVVNAESDGLPGVVADVYGDCVVLQCLTAGAEHWKATLAEVLAEVTGCSSVYERSDVDVRRKEGLEPAAGLLLGAAPPDLIAIEEAGRSYLVDVRAGHKTGFYLDQRDNRSLVQHYAAGQTVLNCFAYTGGFAIAALVGGAAHAVNIDTSQPALDLAAEAAKRSGIEAERMETVCGDVFAVLRRYRNENRQFDIVVLDPPKFVESRNQIEKGARGYKDINLLAFRLLKPGGLLFTFSCSGHMEMPLFQKIVADAALDAGCDARIVRRLDQAADHPVRLAFPEGSYLKGLMCQK